MPSDDQLWAIWNRAAIGDGAAELRGDRALRAAVGAHSLISNGGVNHFIDVAGVDDVRQAQDGFRFLELEAVASLLGEAMLLDEADDEGWDQTEAAYGNLISDDEVLFAAFADRAERDPSGFAPPT